MLFCISPEYIPWEQTQIWTKLPQFLYQEHEVPVTAIENPGLRPRKYQDIVHLHKARPTKQFC